MNVGREKHKRIFVTAVCAAAVICAAVFVLGRKSVPVKEALARKHWNRIIAYVPLDDRTDNTDYVKYEAAACGYTLVMPDRDLYATKLDGQPLNQSGTRHGDREALLQWVRKMDREGCNIFLLSLDQLLSGGLVSSRAMAADVPLTFEDGSEMTEDGAFDRFILALGKDPNNRVYLFDSVMRLASTVGYGGLGLPEYTALREYGSVPRKTLSASELTLDSIIAAYPFAADGVTPAESGIAHKSVLSQTDIDAYLAARARKLLLISHVMDAISGNSAFHLLVGVDDSTCGGSIQDNEIRYISAHIGGGTVLPGMDSMARLQLACIALEGRKPVTACVQYFGGSENAPSSHYDRLSLRADVTAHMKLLGRQVCDASAADIQVLVLTAPKDAGNAPEIIDALAGRLRETQRLGKPTVLIDASVGSYEGALTDTLLAKADFARLLGYAGHYDYASVAGAALSMGFSRYTCLADGSSAGCDAAHVRQLANSMILSMVYAAGAHAALDRYISSLGYSSSNILAPSAVYSEIGERLVDLIRCGSGIVLKNLTSGMVLSDLNGGTRDVGTVTVDAVSLPWKRSLEISLDISVCPSE